MHVRSLGSRALRVLVVAGLTTAAWAVPAQAYRDVERPATLRHNVAVTGAEVVPGFPIDYVGVVWAEHDEDAHDEHEDERQREPHGAVRFRHGVAWTEWVPLQPDGADAPGQWTSGLIGGGDAEAFQIRGVPADAGSPRAVALNTTDGPKEVVGREPAGPSALTSCKTRAEWGADESLMTWAPEFHPAQVMTVHHTATSNGDTTPDATVRAIYEYHAVDNGWGDIGYQYLVDQYGVVYEGRWSGSASAPCATGGNGADFAHETTAATSPVVTAAHTGGSNSGNVGVALLGDFTYHRKNANTPTTAATSSLTDVLAELSHRHGIAADSSVTYTNPVTLEKRTIDAVSGHRDWKATACPGDNLYAMLPDLRTQTAAKAAAMTTGPAVTFTSPASGATVAGSAVSVKADVSSATVAAVEFQVDGSTVQTDANGTDGWGFSLDTTGLAEGSHSLTAVATDADGTGSATISVTVDNVAEATTVFVVDLDAHTHGKGTLWDAHAVVQVRDSDGNSLPDAYVHGTFSGAGISDTAATCQIDLTRCELHLDGLDKRVVSSVLFTVTGVSDDAGPYDSTKNSDSEGDSDSGTRITISP